jgi:hypothetical protein
MPREEFVQISGRAEFTDEGVLETLRVVVPMSEPCRDLAQAKSILIEQGGVRVAEYVPAHVLDVEGAEGSTERMARLAVRAHQGQIKILKDELRALGERYDTLARTCLGAVHTATHVPGATDVKETCAEVIWPKRKNLPDPQPCEQADHSDMVPGFVELLDYYEKLAHRDVVAAPPVAWYPAARRWKW